MAAQWLMVGELALAGLSLAPFVLHRLNVAKWSKIPLEYPTQNSKLKLTVLLPVWNEALVIEKKLVDLAAQEVNCDLVVVDSASDDNTLSIVESWLADFPDSFNSSKIIRMPKRLGKTPAVILALDQMNDVDGIIVMTDADAFLQPGSFERIQHWFSDATIGAVGGTPQRIGDLGSEKSHRDLYSVLRAGESAFDSTPFLEGSLMAWRAGTINSSDLYPTANADDAQIATAVRLNGLRSIHDSELIFRDYMPTTAKGHRRQKVRRAQGLIRLLVRKRKFWFSSRVGRFSKILRMNAWMHIFSPLLMFGAIMMSILRNISFTEEALWLSIIEMYCLVAWVLVRSQKGFLGIKIAGTILAGMESLFLAMLTTFRGKSLHIWDQHSDVREEISK
ncbi:MAG: glycosyltransferase [Candidatus Poseidoniales archaeon]